MGKVYASLLILIALFSALCGAEATTEEAQALVERSKQRCDDFFNRRHALEVQAKEREKSAQDIKKVRTGHDLALEEARKEFIKNRKPKADYNPELEKQWLAKDQSWKEQNKIAAKRYAQHQREAEAVIRKGCHVPGNLEYDLDEQ